MICDALSFSSSRRLVWLCVFASALFFAPPLAHAEDRPLTGSAVVQDAGSLMIDGKRIFLWGIEPLANDQQCWMGERPWHCGEQASTALKHFVESHKVRCNPKEFLANDAVVAQCFRLSHSGKEMDIAGYLVAHGWALDKTKTSDGLYKDAQDQAQDDEKGAWTSRFQTPEDWQEGVQRFVGEEPDNSDEP